MAIRDLYLTESYVAFAWQLEAGTLHHLELGHNDEATLEDFIVIRDNIGPEEYNLNVTGEFNVTVTNTFTLFLYEASWQQNYSGRSLDVVLEAKGYGKLSVVDIQK